MSNSQVTPFDLVRLEVDGHPVLVVYGELDMVSSPRLHEALSEVINAKASAILVDMANVTFIDSSGLGALVVAHRHLAEAGSELRLVAVPERLANIFQITGLSERFRIFPDMHSATEQTEVSEEKTP
jgi:anti-sigma B factor antagonist